MTRAAGALALLLAVAIQAPAQGKPWKADSIRASSLTEITGRTAFGTWTSKAQKGIIIEVRTRLSGPDTLSVPALDIELRGSSKTATQSSTWKFSAMAVALHSGAGCNYVNQESLVKGAMGQSSPGAGTLTTARDVEGGPVVLTFGPGATRLCFAFPVPAGPTGGMKLRIGKLEYAVPALAAK
ncbi:MAG: hypothetical protein WC700_00965 [Gemmatimonadaceae bacterium]